MVDDFIQTRLDFGDVHSVAEQGLKVVTAQFKGVEPFSWNVFDGFDRMRVLTYSGQHADDCEDAGQIPLCVLRVRLRLRRRAAAGRRRRRVSAVPDQPR